MKKVILITLFLSFIIFGISSEDNVAIDLPDLIEEIEKVTDKNWTIEFGNREHIVLTFKKEIIGFEEYISDSEQSEPKKIFYEFHLFITPKISPENFNEYRKETKETFDNLKKKALEQIKNENMKEIIFYPTNKKERELYLRYLKAEKAYRDIPEYYYKNIGIISRKYKNTRAESKDQKEILKNAEKQEQDILKLLTKY